MPSRTRSPSGPVDLKMSYLCLFPPTCRVLYDNRTRYWFWKQNVAGLDGTQISQDVDKTTNMVE